MNPKKLISIIILIAFTSYYILPPDVYAQGPTPTKKEVEKDGFMPAEETRKFETIQKGVIGGMRDIERLKKKLSDTQTTQDKAKTEYEDLGITLEEAKDKERDARELLKNAGYQEDTDIVETPGHYIDDPDADLNNLDRLEGKWHWDKELSWDIDGNNEVGLGDWTIFKQRYDNKEYTLGDFSNFVTEYGEKQEKVIDQVWVDTVYKKEWVPDEKAKIALDEASAVLERVETAYAVYQQAEQVSEELSQSYQELVTIQAQEVEGFITAMETKISEELNTNLSLTELSEKKDNLVEKINSSLFLEESEKEALLTKISTEFGNVSRELGDLNLDGRRDLPALDDLTSLSILATEAQETTPANLESAIDSDFDGSGVVDFGDFKLFVAAYGEKAGEIFYDSVYDLNDSGTIDLADFSIFVSNYGTDIYQLIESQLKDPEATVEEKREAIEALGESGTGRAIDALISHLSNEPDEGNRSLILAIIREKGQERDVEIAEIINNLCYSLDSETRDNAVRKLYKHRKDPRIVEPLIQALDDEDQGVRSIAIEILGWTGDHRAVESIIEILEYEPIFMNKAIWALGELRDKRAVAPLIEILKDGDIPGNRRRSAAEALGKIGDVKAVVVSALLDALIDSDRRVQIGAATGLALMGVKEALEAVPLLCDEVGNEDASEYWRAEAAEALGLIGRILPVDQSVVELLIRVLADGTSVDSVLVRRRAAWALGEIGNIQALESLIEKVDDLVANQLENTNVGWFVRESIVKICNMHGFQAIEILAGKLATVKNPKTYVEIHSLFRKIITSSILSKRRTIIQGLGKSATPQAVYALLNIFIYEQDQETRDLIMSIIQEKDKAEDVLILERLHNILQVIDHSSNHVRYEAVNALVTLDDARVEDLLIGVLLIGERAIQWDIIPALGTIGTPRSVEILISILHDSFTTMVISALGRAGDPRAVEPLVNLASIFPDWFKDDVLSALVEIGEPALKELRRLLNHSNSKIAKMAEEMLEKVEEMLEKEDSSLELLLSRQPQEIESQLKDPEATVEDREKAIRLLGETAISGQVDVKQAVDILIAHIMDEDNEANRSLIIRTLEEMKDKGLATEQDVEVAKNINIVLYADDWQERRSAVQRLGEIGDPRAIDPLIKALGDEHPSVREMAAWALGEIGDHQTVDPLIKVLGDEDEYFWPRGMAARALGEIGVQICMKIDEVGEEGEVLLSRIIGILIEASGDEDHFVRERAEQALAKIFDSPEIASILVQVESGQLEPEQAVNGLFAQLAYEPDKGNRNLIIKSIELIGTEIDLKVAKDINIIFYPFAFYPAHFEERKEAARRLVIIGDPRVEGIFIEALRNCGDSVIRRMAAWALGEVVDPQAAEESLIEALDDEHGGVRIEAKRALEKIGYPLRNLIRQSQARYEGAEIEVKEPVDGGKIGRLTEDIVGSIRSENGLNDEKIVELKGLVQDLGFELIEFSMNGEDFLILREEENHIEKGGLLVIRKNPSRVGAKGLIIQAPYRDDENSNMQGFAFDAFWKTPDTFALLLGSFSREELDQAPPAPGRSPYYVVTPEGLVAKHIVRDAYQCIFEGLRKSLNGGSFVQFVSVEAQGENDQIYLSDGTFEPLPLSYDEISNNRQSQLFSTLEIRFGTDAVINDFITNTGDTQHLIFNRERIRIHDPDEGQYNIPGVLFFSLGIVEGRVNKMRFLRYFDYWASGHYSVRIKWD